MKQAAKNVRRSFMHRTAQVALGGFLGSLVSNTSASSDIAGFALDSSTEGKCATCNFWGGIRKLSADGKSITTQSLGWCNNPKSHNYQKMTPPDLGPMKAWKKWGALT